MRPGSPSAARRGCPPAAASGLDWATVAGLGEAELERRLLGGSRATVVGCVANWRWCDVIAGRDRGWVYSRYLSMPFEGTATLIASAGPKLGLPVLDFAFGPYWDEHYPTRLFFSQKASWQKRSDQRRAPPEWSGPSPRR
jgi:uncharacterized protein YraI